MDDGAGQWFGGLVAPDDWCHLRIRVEKDEVLAEASADGKLWEGLGYHLRRGDYSRWFRTHVKDDQLASDAEGVERETDISADESRDRIRELIDRYYSLSASPPLPMPGTDAAPVLQS